MEKFDATFLAGIEKSNDFNIHERHALEVQRDGRLLAIDLHLQFIAAIYDLNRKVMEQGGYQ